jgi:hypothetical protein
MGHAKGAFAFPDRAAMQRDDMGTALSNVPYPRDAEGAGPRADSSQSARDCS